MVPSWNLAIRWLVNHPLKHHDHHAVSHYAPRTGFHWVWEEENVQDGFEWRMLSYGQWGYQDKEILDHIYTWQKHRESLAHHLKLAKKEAENEN
jgi:hypothetical protein